MKLTILKNDKKVSFNGTKYNYTTKLSIMNNDLLDSEGIKYKNSIQLEQKTKSSVDLLNDLKGGI